MGFRSDGKTLAWSYKNSSKEYATFQLPCGKCISCRLENARQTAVRCVHEAQMHENNIFLTLTYNDTHLGSNRLEYADFQQFVKKLRYHIFQGILDKMFPKLPQSDQRKLWNKLPSERKEKIHGSSKISVFCTGEYGDKSKRKHWHALIFNYRPNDETPLRVNELGHKICHSKILEDLWGKGIIEYGDVTFESAGYCARYASKKLVHGHDGTHDYNPISKRSSANAIGKSWITKYWPDVFSYGYIILPGGRQCGIPRYYEKWLRENQPAAWNYYVTQTKLKLIESAVAKEVKHTAEERRINLLRHATKGHQISRNKVRDNLLKKKFEILQKYQKEIKC